MLVRERRTALQLRFRSPPILNRTGALLQDDLFATDISNIRRTLVHLRCLRPFAFAN
jgi:hypothetical protein